MIYQFLSLDVVKSLEPLARAENVSTVARSPRGFLTAYKRVKGRPEDLSVFWLKRRQAFIKRHMAQVQKRGEALFDANGVPTRRHLALIMWAYSPA